MHLPMDLTMVMAILKPNTHCGPLVSTDNYDLMVSKWPTAAGEIPSYQDCLNTWTHESDVICGSTSERPKYPIEGRFYRDMDLATSPKLGVLIQCIQNEWVDSAGNIV